MTLEPRAVYFTQETKFADSSFRVVERSASAASPSSCSSSGSDSSLSLSLSPRAWRPAAQGPPSPAPVDLVRGPAPRDEFIADAASLGDYLRWVAPPRARPVLRPRKCNRAPCRHYAERSAREAPALAGCGPACGAPPLYQLASADFGAYFYCLFDNERSQFSCLGPGIARRGLAQFSQGFYFSFKFWPRFTESIHVRKSSVVRLTRSPNEADAD